MNAGSMRRRSSVVTDATSSDGATWTDRYSTTAGPGGSQSISFPSVSARYVRMNGTDTNGLGYDIFEFAVYTR